MTEYRIIGQGIAGTILSMRMEMENIPFQLWDDPGLSSSSKIAAGIANPIVLKRLKLVHEAQYFYEELPDFYRYWEEKLKTDFFKPIAIHHIFQSQGEQNLWLEKSENPAFKPFLGEVTPYNHSHLRAPFGVGVTKQTFWVDTDKLIRAYRDHLKKQGRYHQATVSPHTLPPADKASLIWCTGHLMRKDALSEIFTPTKGEVLVIRSSELSLDHILHAGVFILPLGNHLFKVGATYAWNHLDEVPSQQGLKTLETELRKIYNGPYEIVDHLAGIRPNIKDRKPIMGRCEDGLVFNGLGSRGVLLAPRLSKTFVQFLNGGELPSHYNLNRFT